jgi:hypothetical protein
MGRDRGSNRGCGDRERRLGRARPSETIMISTRQQPSWKSDAGVVVSVANCDAHHADGPIRLANAKASCHPVNRSRDVPPLALPPPLRKGQREWIARDAAQALSRSGQAMPWAIVAGSSGTGAGVLRQAGAGGVCDQTSDKPLIARVIIELPLIAVTSVPRAVLRRCFRRSQVCGNQCRTSSEKASAQPLS